MAIHDYVIDNQSAPAFRSDLNNALQAIVTQNSNATAPTTTYANMVWYDTAANQLKKRNEANSAWIVLGTINEGTGTFTPSGERALATQAQAEAGTDNTTVMTPLRTFQAISTGTSGIAAGAVGSYAFLYNDVGTVDTSFGATLAGSNLIPAGIRGTSSVSVVTEATPQSGTWRCMGFSDYRTVIPSVYRPTTLWLRIS